MPEQSNMPFDATEYRVPQQETLLDDGAQLDFQKSNPDLISPAIIQARRLAEEALNIASIPSAEEARLGKIHYIQIAGQNLDTLRDQQIAA